MSSRDPEIDVGLQRLVRSQSGATEAEIGQALATSESFRTLSADLRACSRALARWRKVDSAEARERVGEYTELLAELTGEIRSMLAERDPADPRNDE